MQKIKIDHRAKFWAKSKCFPQILFPVRAILRRIYLPVSLFWFIQLTRASWCRLCAREQRKTLSSLLNLWKVPRAYVSFFCESPPGLTSLHLLSQLLLSSYQYSSGFPPLVPPVSFPQQIRKRSTHLDQSNRHCRQHDNIRSVKGNSMELGNNAFFTTLGWITARKLSEKCSR